MAFWKGRLPKVSHSILSSGRYSSCNEKGIEGVFASFNPKAFFDGINSPKEAIAMATEVVLEKSNEIFASDSFDGSDAPDVHLSLHQMLYSISPVHFVCTSPH